MNWGECPWCGAVVDHPYEYSRLNYESCVLITLHFCSDSCRQEYLDAHPYILPRLEIKVERRKNYAVAPDGSIVWINGPEDYQYLWEEFRDNLPQSDDWD